MNLIKYCKQIFLSVYQTIGPCGMVLILAAGVCLYLILKDFVYLWWVQRSFFKFAEDPRKTLAHEDAAKKVTDKNPLLAIIFEIAVHHGRHSEDIRSEVAYLFHYYFKGIIGEVTLLRLIAVVSPLLGLMGTVLGMVDVFRVVSTQAAVDPALLAGGIWEALITTIMGLAVAVPALVFHHLLSLRMRGLQLTAVEFGYRAEKIFGEPLHEGAYSSPYAGKDHEAGVSAAETVHSAERTRKMKRSSLEAVR